MVTDAKMRAENYVNSVQWHKRLEREIPFLKDLFTKHSYQKLLDLGCGPGFHPQKLADLGFEVVGLDLSEPMINYALEHHTKASFRRGNFLDDPSLLEGEFDMIYSLGNALMIIWSHLGDNQTIQDMFDILGNAIRPGGGLFFQVLNSDNPRSGYVVSKITKTEDSPTPNSILVKHFLPLEGKLHTHFITLRWPDGGTEVVEEPNDQGHLMLLPLTKLQTILAKAGFGDHTFYENYSGDPLDPETSDSLLCFARKNP